MELNEKWNLRQLKKTRENQIDSVYQKFLDNKLKRNNE
jgi:hypothetical protein